MAKLFDIIKYEGDNSIFIWKHPCEDFNMLSQLIVHENQEAVFYMNGQALDLFGPGRYTLKTQNIPLIGRVLNLATGGLSPFHCEVYFINKAEQMSVKWGTDSRVQFVEPTYNFPLSIGACGEMSLQVINSKKLLVKLVGTETGLEQKQLVSYFRSFLMTRIKSYMAQIIKSQSINIFEIDEKLSLFSDEIRQLLLPDFADYGISLEKFFVTKIMKPDGEAQYEKFKELHFRQYMDIAEAKLLQQTGIIHAETEAQKTIIDSRAQALKRTQEGYTYQQEHGFDVAKRVAENEAIGEFTNLGIGFGTMAGVGGTVGTMVSGMMNHAMNSAANTANVHPATAQQENAFCENCGAKIFPNSAFCDACGTPVVFRCDSCKQCGYQFERPSKFCPKCGTKREV